MIPPNIEDKDVLRRTLEDISNSIPKLYSDIEMVNMIDAAATLPEAVTQLNILADRINTISSLLNQLKMD